MLPPALEVYVIWHPQDRRGTTIAQEIIEHFHGTAFTGLIGGAVEVYLRSEPWATGINAPRPVPIGRHQQPNGVAPSQYTVLVPLFGTELAAEIEDNNSDWHRYLAGLVEDQTRSSDRVAWFPYRMDASATDQTTLGRMLGHLQCIAPAISDESADSLGNARCRDLAQGITQFISGENRLIAFISHTKRSSVSDTADVRALISLVRQVISETRLREFFDASDLQPGQVWDQELERNASNSALLALRTDLYPSREWCQREMLLAKRHGMPVITLDAIGEGEERGSFLMDHVPRVPIRVSNGSWNRGDVFRSLNLLVDECLKRALWECQKALSMDRPGLEVAWWAPHAPEPLTLIDWLEKARASDLLPSATDPVRILHPDPPLGRDERNVLEQMLTFGGFEGGLEVMTPRQLAARGG